MNYRVDELARLGGVRVDTVRFYQTRGLIDPPRREGRIALYDDGHLARLRRVRRLLGRGFSLTVIKRLADREAGTVDPDGTDPDDSLLAAVAEAEEEHVGERSFSRSELATEAGAPAPLMMALEAAGLLDPQVVDGEPYFRESDLEITRAALGILGAGFPLDKLLDLSVRHARHTNETVDRAFEIFDEHIGASGGADPEQVGEHFRELLPHLTRLVAVHFQRTLVSRALAQLERKREGDDFSAARQAVEAARLEVDVSWR